MSDLNALRLDQLLRKARSEMHCATNEINVSGALAAKALRRFDPYTRATEAVSGTNRKNLFCAPISGVIQAHSETPTAFDWKKVNVRA